MVSIQSASGQRTTISTPERGGADWYLLSDAKKHKNFSITPRTISNRFVHTCLISKHIGPFVMARPATMALPLIRTPAFSWKLFTTAEIATSPSAKDHFKEVVDASDYQSMGEFWNACLNYRSKLTKQALTPDSWLVVYGAGGGIPAAAHAQVRDFGDEPPVIDQTLYWITTDSEDEALFLVGIMNSDVLLNRIADFIPEGDFGDRHLHTLPSMAVPQFDPASEEHVRVVSAVKALRLELHEHRSRPRTQKLFTSEVSMVARRRQLRELIKKLESFDTYASACQDVYDSISHEVKPF